MQKRIERATEIISTYDNKGFASATAIIKTGVGVREMGELREAVNLMVGEENKLLVQRQQRVAEDIDLALKVGAAGLLFCVMILIVAFRSILSETEKREITESSLHTTLGDMEEISQGNAMISRMLDYLQSCQTVAEAYEVVGKAMTGIFPGTKGGIFIFNNSRNYLELATHWGEDLSSKMSFSQEECWALRRGQLHIFSHKNSSEAQCAHISAELECGYICLPLVVNGDILGSFHIECIAGNQAIFNKQDLMRRVAEQIAMAIGNLNLQAALREQSFRDPLTHLYNRRYLETTIERELSRARRSKQNLGLLVLDIDHFKKFNDLMGHDAGDLLLVHFAKLLEKNIRKEDIACRYGGEEFIVALPMASFAQGLERAQVIVEATRKMPPLSNSKDSRSVTVSIGVACFPDHGDNLADLISVADQALYKAKDNGRDQVMPAHDMSRVISL